MRIITVIPIGRGMSKDTLTYFTRDDIGHGSLVTIPICGKSSYGLVVGSQSVSDNKSEIKSLSFSYEKNRRGQIARIFVTGVYSERGENRGLLCVDRWCGTFVACAENYFGFERGTDLHTGRPTGRYFPRNASSSNR